MEKKAREKFEWKKKEKIGKIKNKKEKERKKIGGQRAPVDRLTIYSGGGLFIFIFFFLFAIHFFTLMFYSILAHPPILESTPR